MVTKGVDLNMKKARKMTNQSCVLVQLSDSDDSVDGENLIGENDQQIVVNLTEDSDVEIESDESDEEKKNIMSLDDYSLLMIFDRLTVRDRVRCSMVNRRFYRLMEDCWATSKKISFKHTSRKRYLFLDATMLEHTLRKCPLLKQLDLSQATTILNNNLCGIIGACCPRLEKLNLRRVIFEISVTSVGKCCPHLKSIDLSMCNIEEKGLNGLLHLLPRIDELTLEYCRRITGTCLYLCQNLRYLDLSSCDSVVADSFERLAQNCSQTLEVLIAPPLTVTGLRIICRSFRNLIRFEVEQKGFPVLTETSNLRRLTKLETLIFRPELSDLCDSTFHLITSNLPNLTVLKIFGTDKITDASMKDLPEHCPKLRILHLIGCNFGDTSLRGFTQFKHLQQLTVSSSLITNDGAHHIMTHMPSLEIFDFNSRPNNSI